MLGDDSLGYRQAESGAVCVETRGHEGVEDIRKDVCGDALAVVFDRQHDGCAAVALLAARTHFDATDVVRSNGVQSIAKKIDEDLLLYQQ